MRADKLERQVTRSSEGSGRGVKTGETGNKKESGTKDGKESGRDSHVRERLPKDNTDRPTKERSAPPTKEKAAAEPRGRETRTAPAAKNKKGDTASPPQREVSRPKGDVGKRAPPEKQVTVRSEKAHAATPAKSGAKDRAGAGGKTATSKGGKCESVVQDVLERTSKNPKGELSAKDVREIADRCMDSLGPGAQITLKTETTSGGDSRREAKNLTSRAEVEVKVTNPTTNEHLTVVGRRDPYSGKVRTEGNYYNGREDRYESFADGKNTGTGKGKGTQPQTSLDSAGMVAARTGWSNPELKTIYLDPNQMSWHGMQHASTSRQGGSAKSPAASPETRPTSVDAKERRDRPERDPPYKDRSHNPYKQMFEDMGSMAKLGHELDSARARLSALKILDRAKYLQRGRILRISRSKSLKEALGVVSAASKSGQAMRSFAGSVKRLGYLGDAITGIDIAVDVYLAPEGTGTKLGVQRVSSELVKIVIGAGVAVGVVATLPVTASATFAVVTIGASGVVATELYSRLPVGTDAAGNKISSSGLVEAIAGDIYDYLDAAVP